MSDPKPLGGIQCKWDHPAVLPLLHAFGSAYGIQHELVIKMAQAGELTIRMEPTGIWLEFGVLAGLSTEEAGKALNVLSRLDSKVSIGDTVISIGGQKISASGQFSSGYPKGGRNKP